MRKKIEIYDTTLRDGNQGEGVNLSLADKLDITAALDDMGVDFIEGGWPGTNNFDADPRFVDAQGGDMRLRALSPARGASEDGSDLGAYPYGS